MLEINGRIHRILIPKKTKNDYYILPMVIAHKCKGQEQLRYVQVVSKHVQQCVTEMSEGDKVRVRLILKGQYNATQGKFFNLDEVEEISLID